MRQPQAGGSPASIDRTVIIAGLLLHRARISAPLPRGGARFAGLVKISRSQSSPENSSSVQRAIASPRLDYIFDRSRIQHLLPLMAKQSIPEYGARLDLGCRRPAIQRFDGATDEANDVV